MKISLDDKYKCDNCGETSEYKFFFEGKDFSLYLCHDCSVELETKLLRSMLVR